jgi:hypothetical protein
MKIKLSLLIAICMTIFVSGCSKTQSNCFDFEFENFEFCFHTENKYDLYEDQLNWLGYQLLNNDILKIYRQSNTSGYIWSLIISKKISEKETKDYISENMELVDLDWFKQEKSKILDAICNDEKIEIYVENTKLKNNLNNIYFSQIFFRKNGYIYILSYSTDEINERDQFSTDIRNISCK